MLKLEIEKSIKNKDEGEYFVLLLRNWEGMITAEEIEF